MIGVGYETEEGVARLEMKGEVAKAEGSGQGRMRRVRNTRRGCALRWAAQASMATRSSLDPNSVLRLGVRTGERTGVVGEDALSNLGEPGGVA